MEPSPSAKVSVRAIVVLAAVAVFVFVVDQVAKALVLAHLTEGEQVPVLGNLLVFLFTRNPGAAFSIGTGSTWIFTIIAIAVFVFVIWYARRIRTVWWALVFGLLLGGLLGNLYDRLFRPPGFGQGEVIDFIKIPLLPAIFNLADSAIVAAMALFLVLTLLGVGLDGRRAVRADAAATDAAGVDAPSEEHRDGDA
ncbi:signal peptidase II [Gryllotalpicola koreensis]|uniref:Lipoprotein signal peptidase n=1 Tax=Gryllotalpicola koreensis TaxID=993086 RepID=A0ABP7ZYH0_9MICO